MSELTASNMDAIAYHLEKGLDNGDLSRDTLAKTLRHASAQLRAAADAVTLRNDNDRLRRIVELDEQSEAMWKQRVTALEAENAAQTQKLSEARIAFATYKALHGAAYERMTALETANAEAREIFENIFKRDWTNGKINDKADAWLAAHPAAPAPEPLAEPMTISIDDFAESELSNDELDDYMDSES